MPEVKVFFFYYLALAHFQTLDALVHFETLHFLLALGTLNVFKHNDEY